MGTVAERVAAISIMPVISKLTSDEECEGLAKALTAGGVPAMEITFRMEGADGYIRYVREHFPDVLAGAGTVLTEAQAEKAVEAGAQFIVAPGLNPQIVKFCQEKGVDVFPGVATPSEIEQAMELGIKIVKFFPAEASGGPAAIKALCGPYKGINFMPTGGLNLNNIAGYYAVERVIACGGSFMLGGHLADQEWSEVTSLCKKSVRTMLGLKLAHVGINTPDAENAGRTVGALTELLCLDRGKEGNSSIFVDSCVEVMKKSCLGANGHIGFTTPCLDRAIRYFRERGTTFDEASAKYGDDGGLTAIYFTDEIGGFAIHLAKA
ncbi:bifunctional 4-hydroxy-2-oxoglutarate aldolase/2-dehydro-3-deoxy-phosphogluconate aldolase [Lacrimispora sp. NSJ-141]|uniref:2-dehydro-3-deoxy-phosphogluconate aldolase n=1 Tax=Lientehia hominis TaxID=2897778 RepID=A0AAP2W8L6_9FIRM|nr:bifunctional 4-hydroxy-2-oxoglutarate aldolase/2-dehydro-3-deoxy-phosphogluconate aldolase [Lientehia hominis]MCD2493678.1 bifunctional 4-hydroxy-2-oxoglutarate aldolase/2-dehydro-3-deoxy-phosphogluconate aldolase [Lientehia hominis]